MLNDSPHLVNNIAGAACNGHPKALNAIAGKLGEIPLKQWIEMLKGSPRLVTNIAGAACNGHPKALNAIAGKLKGIPSEQWIEMLNNSPHLVTNIAGAACKGHPKALNAIAVKLGEIPSEQWIKMLNDSPHLVNNITEAACNGSPHLFQTFLRLFIKGLALFKPIVNNIGSQLPEPCLPVVRTIFEYLKAPESVDLSSPESIFRLNNISPMAIPYLLEHGLVPPNLVEKYQINVRDEAYKRIIKVNALVDQILGDTLMTQMNILNEDEPTGTAKNKYIKILLKQVINYLFKVKIMDATKKEYHLNHEFSYEKDLIDCIRLLIRFRVRDFNAADLLITTIVNEWRSHTRDSLIAYVDTKIEGFDLGGVTVMDV